MVKKTLEEEPEGRRRRNLYITQTTWMDQAQTTEWLKQAGLMLRGSFVWPQEFEFATSAKAHPPQTEWPQGSLDCL